MTNEIEARKMFQVQGKSKSLFISNEELISHGCKNCIWRLHHQCKHGINSSTEFHEYTETEKDENGKEVKIKHSGYCKEYVNFLFSFASEEDSISAVWEKFHLYVARMQSLEDYSEYIKLTEELIALESTANNKEERMRLEMKKDTLRLWWERLNDTLRKGYTKIVDREHRSKENIGNMPGIMNAKVINFNMGETKQIGDKK